jgi:hypothetical protein
MTDEHSIIYAGVNLDFSEVNWFYTSGSSTAIDRVVTYNYLEKLWTIGTLARTTWASKDVFANPLATRYYTKFYNTCTTNSYWFNSRSINTL